MRIFEYSFFLLLQQLVFHVRCMFPPISMVGKPQNNKFLPKAIFVTYLFCPSLVCSVIQGCPEGWAAQKSSVRATGMGE